MLEMELSIGKFEFEILGSTEVYEYDRVTDEEGDLLQTNVVASIGLKAPGLEYGIQNENFINRDDYDQFISDLQMCVDKPNFYNMMLSPGVQILSVPGRQLHEKESELTVWDQDDITPEGYTREPAIVIILYLSDENGYTPSSLQISLDESEIRKLIDYLEDSRKLIETCNIIS